MKHISFGIACCMLFAMVLFNSCAKDGKDGAAGATGPAGPAGATGPAGPAGSAGAKGDTGVANVIYSAWLDVVYVPDTVRTGTRLDTVGYYTIISAPKMTANILSRGEIKVYWNLGTAASPTVVPIPYFDGGVLINPYFYLTTAGAGIIELDANISLSSFTATAAPAGRRQQVRYILIPGGVPARSIINWNNYAEVKEYLHLPD